MKKLEKDAYFDEKERLFLKYPEFVKEMPSTQMKIVTRYRSRLGNRHYLLCAAICYVIFIIIYFSCGRFYGAQTLICYSRLLPEETASFFKLSRLQLAANVTAQKLYQKVDKNEKLFTRDRLFRMASGDKEYFKGGKLKAQSTLKEEESREGQSQVDRLWPLREMFAKAGAEYKEKVKALNWTSTEVPLSDLRVKASKLEVILLVIVSSAPERQDRRNAIRETWWKRCSQVVCLAIFFNLSLDSVLMYLTFSLRLNRALVCYTKRCSP